MIDTLTMLSYLLAQPFGNPHSERAFKLKSPAFAHHRPVPHTHTCHDNTLPIPLHWSGVPKGTQSLTLIMTDQDVPRRSQYYHWVAFNIPANTKHLKIGTPLANNSWKKPGYQPPCPSSGLHHYQFRLYALNTVLPAQAAKNPVALRKAMRHHILGSAHLLDLVKEVN